MENPRVLYYLDDDTDDLHFFKEVAEGLGHKVELFVNGNIMLKSLKKGNLPDILFLDIRMPVYDGEQILDIIKKNDDWKQLPVVMISGGFAKSDVSRYLATGANYIMKKPDTLGDLKASLQEILRIDWDSFQAYS